MTRAEFKAKLEAIVDQVLGGAVSHPMTWLLVLLYTVLMLLIGALIARW